MSRDIYGCRTGGGVAIGIYWVESMDAAKYPTMHSPHNKLSGPRYKCVQVEKTCYKPRIRIRKSEGTHAKVRQE